MVHPNTTDYVAYRSSTLALEIKVCLCAIPINQIFWAVSSRETHIAKWDPCVICHTVYVIQSSKTSEDTYLDNGE